MSHNGESFSRRTTGVYGARSTPVVAAPPRCHVVALDHISPAPGRSESHGAEGHSAFLGHCFARLGEEASERDESSGKCVHRWLEAAIAEEHLMAGGRCVGNSLDVILLEAPPGEAGGSSVRVHLERRGVDEDEGALHAGSGQVPEAQLDEFADLKDGDSEVLVLLNVVKLMPKQRADDWSGVVGPKGDSVEVDLGVEGGHVFVQRFR
jgi:hypothetical protein